MKGAPTIKSILHFLLVVLLLLLPRLAFAEEPMLRTTDPAPPSSPPTLRQAQDTAFGGKEGGRGAMEFKAGEIIVKFKEDIPQAGVQSLLLAEDVSILDEMDNLGLMLLSVPKGREMEKIEELRRNPLVEYAEPNCMIKIADSIAAGPHFSLRAPDVIPNDPRYPSQWNLPKIEAPAAWDITTGSDKVVIAFVDSGIDLDHPELEDKIWTNPREKPDNGIDDDGNGYIDDVHGWDFVNWDNEPQDDNGLGTYVATVAAAEANNGYGIAGVSWGAEIMPVKVFDKDGRGYLYKIVAGINYAADKRAKIINVDLATPNYSNSLELAIVDAYNKGSLVVAPVGDCAEGCNGLINPETYPAALPHVLAVAATSQNDERMFFSGHGPYIDVAAPGELIPGFWLRRYATYSSTAFAAPHVVGLAALIWSVNPTLTNDKVEEIIKSTAVDQVGDPAEDTPGRDDYFGYGRINARAAVMATPHYLEVEPDDGLYFLVCDDCDPPSRKITNPNTSCSTWSATAIAPWLSISPCEGYTPSWVTVSINKGDLPNYGLHTAVITATSTMTNHVNNPRTITATVNYSSQCWRNYLPLLFKEL